MAQLTNYLTDPELPFLSLALDSNMVRHFCQALISDNVDASISNCRVARLRYRRAQRCIIQYELTLRLADGSEQTHWLVGYQYASSKKFRARANQLKRLTDDRHPVDGLLPGIVVEEIRLLLHRFPFDHRLPSLVSLYFDIDRLVSLHLADMLGSKDWELECLDARLARWRVGLSAVLRLDLVVKHRRTGESRHHKLFAKLDATDTDSSIRSRLEQRQSSGQLPFDLAPTLLSLPQQGLTIQACAEGLALEIMLLEDVAKLGDARRFANVLALWHIRGEPLQSRYSKEDFEAVLERSVGVLANAAASLSLRLERLAQRIGQRMKHGLYCPAHLDLKPEHIFFRAEGITLIDIESAADADPMIDIAILYAGLRHASALYGLPDTASHYFALQLMSAYHQRVPSDWWRNFPACYAWALLKLAVYLFTCQRPDWSDWIERFVTEAELAISQDADKLPFLSEGKRRAQPAYHNESVQRIQYQQEVTL